MPDAEHVFQVAIIGAGFSGLGMAIRLKQAGEHDFVVLEKADDVGGTWRENTYPGCACDIPSYLYSYSFEPNPRWTRHYPEQQEIWDYLRHCARKYGITPHIRFGATMSEAAWDDEAMLWRLSLDSPRDSSPDSGPKGSPNGSPDGGREVVRARTVVSAMGPLHVPSFPDIAGLDRFGGPVFHSARWDHGVDLDGKRVAVVGTGASAIQFVPHLAERARSVHVFQRTPPWIVPKLDHPIGRIERLAHRLLPPVQRLRRAAIYWVHEIRVLGMVFNPKLLKVAEKLAVANLHRAIDDPEMRRQLTPDYQIGCKRILISNDYYPALAKPHVHLVTEKISEVREHAVVTADGTEHEVDAIVLGTGFHVVDAMDQLPIAGSGGVRLRDAWRGGVEAYYGTAVAGFPNLFLLAGPNTGLGHNSIVFMIEAQVRYVLGCLELLRRSGGRALRVRERAQREFNDGVQAKLVGTVWGTGCDSWYLDDAGKNRTIWPGFTFSYWWQTRRPRAADFEVVR